MIRRVFLVLVVVVVLLAAVVDRLADSAAQNAIANKIKNAALLASNPSVNIHGFPFLTQAIGGNYHEISVTTHGIHRGGVRIDTIHADFYGVHISLGNALSGKVDSVPIDRSDGSITLTFADLNSFTAKRQITVSAQGSRLRITGHPTVGTTRAEVSGTARITVSGTTVTVTPDLSSLASPAGALSASQRATIAGTLTTMIDTGRLPFGLNIQRAQVTPTGITVTAVARGLTVRVPADASQP